jgi:hypothetical protein
MLKGIPLRSKSIKHKNNYSGKTKGVKDLEFWTQVIGPDLK